MKRRGRHRSDAGHGGESLHTLVGRDDVLDLLVDHFDLSAHLLVDLEQGLERLA